MKIKICKSCIMISTRPRITYDKNGICNACQWKEEKKKINWKIREKKFKDIVSQIKSKKNNFDVLVPVSGGKDSCYVAYNLKYKYKLNPLYVTVNPTLQSDLGKRNLKNFNNKGFNLFTLDASPEFLRKIDKQSLISFGQPYFGWLTAIYTAIPNLATSLGIDLIIYGDNGEVEYGGSKETKDKFLYDGKYVEKILLSNKHKKIFSKIDLRNEDKFFFELQKKRKFHYAYYSYLENWDPYKNYLFAKEKFDMEENTRSNPSTFTNFSQNDQKLYPLHTYLMYLKFGFGRACQDACIEIRRDAMTRDQAIALVNLYDHLFPKEHLKDYLEYYGMSLNKFKKILDSFANKKILKKKNNTWKTKFVYK